MLRWQGTQRAVAILVSFTELPSILELSRFGDDDRRVSLAAVPFAHRWLAEILPGTGILETRAIHAGGGAGPVPSSGPVRKLSDLSYDQNPSRAPSCSRAEAL